MSEEQKTEDGAVEDSDTDEDILPSLAETSEDLKELTHESVGRAKNVGLNPVRAFATELVETAADAVDNFFNVFENVFSGKRKRKKRPRQED